MRIIDTLIVFRILKMLTTPWEKMQAYKFGFIDKKGTRVKKIEVDGKMVDNNPETSEEKSSLTPLHRLVFNLKKIINKVPFGKSQFASYAVALLLLKEDNELDEEQMEELCEKFYRHLKELGKVDAEVLEESMSVGKLEVGKYNLRRRLEWIDKEYAHKTEIVIAEHHSKVFGIDVYIGYMNGVNEDRVLVTENDVY
jgi:hypothetical protein|tara:strand:- start:4159 stop:4749 length:591 start_codon:yes stop_codon:yes gene_type:complete